MGDQKARAVAVAFDVEAHHVRQFVAGVVGVEIVDRGQDVRLSPRAQPRIQEHPLLDGFDDGRIGTLEFHVGS